MKTKTIFKIALAIILLIGILFLINWVSGVDKDYKKTIETAKAKISLLDEQNYVLVDSTINLNKVVDSLSKIISRAKLDVIEEIQKRKQLEIENRKELSKLKKLPDQEQVKYFITKTGEDYEIIKYDGDYLIQLSSIKKANEIFVDSDFHIKQNMILIRKIQRLNDIVFNQKEKYDILEKQNSILNKQISNYIEVRKNLDVIVDKQNNGLFKLRLSKNITIGVAAIAIGFLVLK